MKVSVIIPVYNVDKYLNKCIESVIVQTYKEIEIILVDDGSTDDSGKLCDFWKTQDDRVCVIHKNNGGLSDARNVGIDKATGEYLVFVDSDDYIDPKMIEHLIYLIKKGAAEIAICRFNEVYNDDYERKTVISTEFEKLSGRESVIRRYKNQDVQFVTAWAKMYHKKFFNLYRYPVGKYHEDEFLTYKILYEANVVVRSDEKLYLYRQRKNSIMSKMQRIHPDLIEAHINAISFFEKRNDFQLAAYALDWALGLQIELFYQMSDERERKKLYSDIKKLYNSGIEKKLLTGNRRIKKLFLINASLYKVVIPMLRKMKYILGRKQDGRK